MAASTKTLEVIRDRGATTTSFDVTTALEDSSVAEKVIDLRALGHGEFFEFRFLVSGAANQTGFADRMNKLALDLTPLGSGY